MPAPTRHEPRPRRDLRDSPRPRPAAPAEMSRTLLCSRVPDNQLPCHYGETVQSRSILAPARKFPCAVRWLSTRDETGRARPPTPPPARSRSRSAVPALTCAASMSCWRRSLWPLRHRFVGGTTRRGWLHQLERLADPLLQLPRAVKGILIRPNHTKKERGA